MVIRRVLESVTRSLPLMVVLFVPLLFGISELYAWARPGALARPRDRAVSAPVFTSPVFLGRAGAYFAVC